MCTYKYFSKRRIFLSPHNHLPSVQPYPKQDSPYIKHQIASFVALLTTCCSNYRPRSKNIFLDSRGFQFRWRFNILSSNIRHVAIFLLQRKQKVQKDQKMIDYSSNLLLNKSSGPTVMISTIIPKDNSKRNKA